MDKNKKALFGIVAAVAVVCVVVALVVNRGGQKEGDKEVIKIGVIIPLTGSAAPVGKEMQNGIELAVNHANAQNDKTGKIFSVFFEDSMNDAQKGVAAYQKLSQVNKVDVIITGFTTPSIAIAETIASESTNSPPLIATFVTPSDFPKISPKVFRVNYVSEWEAPQIAEFMIRNKSLKTCCIYHSNDDYGRDIVKHFSNACKTLGGTIKLIESFEVGQSDHRVSLEKIKASEAEFCYFVGNEKTFAHAMRQARQINIRIPFATPTTFAVQTYFDIVKDTDGDIFFCSPEFNVDLEHATGSRGLFYMEYKKQYGVSPSFLSGYPYSIIELIAQAEKQREVNTTLCESIASLKSVETIAGKMTPDLYGDIKMPTVVRKLVHGIPQSP